MASEKGDLPQDTDSLPPNYALSEAFTDSPPPAYRKTSTVRLQITRVVCFTILAAGFLIGVFILANTWIQTRNGCDCSAAPNLPLRSAGLVGSPDLHSSNQVKPDDDLMNLDVDEPEDGDFIKESRQMDIPLPFEEEMNENSLDDEEELLDDEQEEELSSEIEEAEKKVKLPVDLLFGNPALAGKDVQCKVEKKVQNLGAGILSKTIIVTCDDDNEDDDSGEEKKIINPFASLLGSRAGPRPPMSLLAPILKMMAARANARLQKQLQPQPSLRRLPQPFLQPIGVAVNGPFPHPMNIPQPAGRFEGPMPFPDPSVQGRMRQPVFFPGSPVISGNSVVGPVRPPIPFPPHPMNPENQHFEEEEEEEMSFHREEEPLPFGDFRNGPPQQPHFVPNFERNEPIRAFNSEPIFRPLPPQVSEPEIITGIKKESPIKVVQGFPPKIPDAIKQIVSHIMKNANKNGKDKVIAIKAIPEGRSIEPMQEPPKSKVLMPFPFRAVKMQTRGGRMLKDMENEDESLDNGPFPLPRGAVSTGLKPIIMPGPAGRALDSPVTLPSPQELPSLRFFPGRLLRLPVPLPERRAVTHMEIKENPNTLDFDEEQQENIEEEQISESPEPETVSTIGPDFGPPRQHTVLTGTPPPMQDNISQDSKPLSPFVSRIPPPPPKFAREGRTGIIREINPEAELVTPAETREHHLITVN